MTMQAVDSKLFLTATQVSGCTVMVRWADIRMMRWYEEDDTVEILVDGGAAACIRGEEAKQIWAKWQDWVKGYG